MALYQREGQCCGCGNLSVRQSVVMVDTHKGQVRVGANIPSVKEEAFCPFGLCSSTMLLAADQDVRLSSGDVVL